MAATMKRSALALRFTWPRPRDETDLRYCRPLNPIKSADCGYLRQFGGWAVDDLGTLTRASADRVPGQMGLDWQPRSVPSALASGYRRDGFWTDESLGGLLAGRLAARPEQTFKLRSDLRPWSGTFGDVLDGSRRVAAGLAAVGVGAGDVVAFQLPNWVEAALLFYGAALLGAVVVPIVHFYGAKEVRYILDRSGARVLVAADAFRGVDYLSTLDALVGDMAALERVYVVGDDAGRWKPFSKLLDAAHLELMRVATMGGAPVPRAVAERVSAAGMSMIRMYGSTEHPSTTGSTHGVDPADKGMYTDGRPLPGVDVRLVDESGVDVGVGAPGEILSRGPDLFEGYTDPALTAAAFVDGWYVTGDVGVLDSDGYLTITDRKKDIIIRGGENVSAAEVEELLLRVPGVAEAAVVAAPDARRGEHGCAFVRMLPGASSVDLEAVRSHLSTAGRARQKWPEALRLADAYPRTASGKVQKFV